MKNIGLIGCGNIAETYFRSQEYFNNIKFITCADIYEEASKKCAIENNIKSQTVDELLCNPDVDVVLNLTIPQAHYDISKKTLFSGIKFLPSLESFFSINSLAESCRLYFLPL